MTANGKRICDSMPGMPSVVVVQSDDLAAWIGVAGVVIGIVLGASVDAARHHTAQRRQRQKDLNRAAADILLTGMAFGEAERAVNEHPDDAGYLQILDAKQAEMARVLDLAAAVEDDPFKDAAFDLLEKARNGIVRLDPAETRERLDALTRVLQAFIDARAAATRGKLCRWIARRHHPARSVHDNRTDEQRRCKG